MWIDIALALVACLTAILGAVVTFWPANSHKQKMQYLAGFIALGITAVVLVGVQSYQRAREYQFLVDQVDPSAPCTREIVVESGLPQRLFTKVQAAGYRGSASVRMLCLDNLSESVVYRGDSKVSDSVYSDYFGPKNFNCKAGPIDISKIFLFSKADARIRACLIPE